MNKTDLTAKIAEGTGLSKAEAKKALDVAIESVTEALKAGEKVQIPGFVTISVGDRPERQGKNPLTGEAITIAAKKVVKFKAGADLDSEVQ